jgi:dUTP pyrophosphatase
MIIVKQNKEQKNMNIMLDSTALMPKRGHATDAGLDLLSPRDVVVPAGESAIIDTGVHVELPNGTAGFLKSKSGLNVKHGITSEGVIDVGYTGSIVCKLYNNSNDDYQIKRGDKITQLVIVKIETPNTNVVDELDETERGEGGFGSTGR